MRCALAVALRPIVAQYVGYEVFVIVVLGPEHGRSRPAGPSSHWHVVERPVTRIECTKPQAFIFVNMQDALGVLTSWAVTQTTASKWIPGGEMFEYICQDDAR
jgi:hypothetical protein